MKSIKPRSILQKRFIAAESNSLVIETIETFERDSPRRSLSTEAGKGTVPSSACVSLKLGVLGMPMNTMSFVLKLRVLKGREKNILSKEVGRLIRIMRSNIFQKTAEIL